MSQDNKKSFVMYQGNGSNNVFSVPMTKGKYGAISVAFVRRGLDQYEYNPDTWGLNGGLFAWDLSGTKVYTDTATPAIGATIYDQYGVDTGDTVTAVGGATITVNTNVYTRDTLHDVDENTVLTWTGDTLQIGDYIVIERTTTRTQPFEFQNNQKHIEKSDDNLERQIQEVADKVDNALLVDPTHTIDSNKMNPVEWMETILRSVDKSVRGFRYLNGWLDYSLDDPNVAGVDKTWTHLVNTDNIKAIREQSRIENNETIYYTEYLAQDGSWKTLSDPHKWNNMKLSDLADTDFSNLSAGNFIMFDGLKWKNVYSSATASWGTLLGNIDDQADLKNALDAKVNLDGSSIMTAPLKFLAGSMRGAVGPYLNGVSFWKMDAQYTITNIANLTDSRFLPVTTNAIDLGRSANTWKDLYLGGKAYVATINNGADLGVPNKSGTLATMGDVELAASSGRMLTDQGVWYAKMYSATVPPSAEDATNYADFSQVDSDNNPIIVIYERQSGAWVLSETITPPAEYDGYVPITSKIWDIAEQSGQQGGRVLWNHTSKEFTPYPTIISFEDIEITGDSTVIMPLNPSGNQIVNKDYVDSHVPTGGYHPSLFAHEWDDKLRDDVQWLRADTFSWQQGSVYKAAYKHLRNDMYNWYSWENNGTTIYTKKAYPEVGEKAYSNSALTTEVGEITAVTDTLDITVEKITVNNVVYDSVSGSNIAPTTETVGGVTVQYIPAEDGHKIVTDFHESEVADVYTATGVAWYYIIDYGFKRFKLPRGKHNRYAATLGVVSNGRQPTYTPTDTSLVNKTLHESSTSEGSKMYLNPYNQGGDSPLIVGDESGLVVPQDQDTDQYKYLYFYVGEFTQTAIENTAGLNAELFNDKVDVGHEVIAFQAPNAGNNYTWYRKYADGWVEQGGSEVSVAEMSTVPITLPVVMADTSYTAVAQNNTLNTAADAESTIGIEKTSTTTVTLFAHYLTPNTVTASWQVSGIAAS